MKMAIWQGGGVFIAGNSRFVMHNGEIYRNTSTLEGRGVCVGVSAGFTVNGGPITNNTALSTGRGGGAIFVPHANLSLVAVDYEFKTMPEWCLLAKS